MMVCSTSSIRIDRPTTPGSREYSCCHSVSPINTTWGPPGRSSSALNARPMIGVIPVRARYSWLTASAARREGSALSGVSEPRVGLFGEVVRDRVTGEPSLRFAIADNAPGRLTTEMIRERSADRGWGVVAELLQSHGGRIAVSPSVDPRYAKRIVIELAAAPPP